MDGAEREELIQDLKALFAELRQLGYLDGYEPEQAAGRPGHGPLG